MTDILALSILQQQSIERLVCSGGGAKGMMYPGVYAALRASGVFQGIITISGASAGAITAALMSAGVDPIHLHQAMINTNLNDLMGERIGSAVSFFNPKGRAFLTKNGVPLEAFIRQQFVTAVKSNLTRLINDRLIPTDAPDLVMLVDAILSSPLPVITFGDLGLLHRYFPSTFKELIIPAVRFPNGALQIFNSQRTPDVEVALACRASASIPVMLEPVPITINGERHVYIDGGYYENLPLDYFDQDETGAFMKNQKPAQTMVLAFSPGEAFKDNPLLKALHGSRWYEFIPDAVLMNVARALRQAFQVELCFLLKARQDGVDLDDVQEPLLTHVLTVLDNAFCELMQTHPLDPSMVINIKKLVLLKFSAYFREPSEENPLYQAIKKPGNSAMVEYLYESFKPVVFEPSLMDKFIYDFCVSHLGDVDAPYKNTTQTELEYQKLHADYALRTVALSVGSVGMSDFKKATELSRVMVAMGYLDTMTFIFNHELYAEGAVDSKWYFVDLMASVGRIFNAVQHSVDDMSLTNEFHQLKAKAQAMHDSDVVSARYLMALIKEQVEQQPDSLLAFALTRAIEHQCAFLSAERLFKEVFFKSFELSSNLSFEIIDGTKIYRLAALLSKVTDIDLLSYYGKPSRDPSSRLDLIYANIKPLLVVNSAEQNQAQAAPDELATRSFGRG